MRRDREKGKGEGGDVTFEVAVDLHEPLRLLVRVRKHRLALVEDTLYTKKTNYELEEKVISEL